MSVTQEEIQALVDGIAPGIAVTIHTVDEPTYETEDGELKRIRVEDGSHRFVGRYDDKGEHIRHPVSHLHLQLGPVTKSIQLAWGGASAHEHVPRPREEVIALVRRSVLELIPEARRKPPTAAEHAAWMREQAESAAARAAAARAQHAAELRAAMSPAELAAANYFAKHGEGDFFAQPLLEHHEAHITAAVASGEMSADEADRIACWKRRCELREAAAVTHAGDPQALAAAHAKINEGF